MKNGLVLARVAGTHPEDNSLDLLMVDTGAQLAGVQIAGSHASTRSGTIDLPEVATPKGNKWGVEETSDDMLAIVGYAGRQPVVLGFLYPQVNQMLFKDGKRRVNRHQSDVYTSTDGDGNFEFYHPSGTYVRIGENPDHEDLTGQDFDKKWKIERNTSKKVSVRIGMAGGAATVTISPDGSISVLTQKTVNVEAQGEATVKAEKVTLDTSNVHCTGDVNVDGDVIASGVSLVNHLNTGVVPGGALSGPPAK